MVLFALAIVLAIVAVVLYRVFDIRAVRDALTGRTAAREIADLRGVRRGAWQHADEFGARRSSKRGARRDDTTGSSGVRDTSDIEFRPVTGTGSGSMPTEDGETRTGAGAKVAAPASAQSATSARHADTGKPSTLSDSAVAANGDANAQPDLDDHFVEIPVSLASAAELADEGETSLLEFRKTEQASDDDDESRTILVRGGKNK